FNILDCHRLFADTQNTGRFAGRRAYAAGKLRKIVRLQEAPQGFWPSASINQIIPFWYQVVDRASRRHAVQYFPRMAKWDTAIHTPSALSYELVLGKMSMELVPIAHPVTALARDRQVPRVLHESCGLTHLSVYPRIKFKICAKAAA